MNIPNNNTNKYFKINLYVKYIMLYFESTLKQTDMKTFELINAMTSQTEAIINMTSVERVNINKRLIELGYRLCPLN
jgi:hypothetical protein